MRRAAWWACRPKTVPSCGSRDDWKMHVALSPSPVDLGDGRLLLSSGYNKDGSLFLQLEEQDGTFTAEAARRLTPKQFNSEQQTPILYDGHLFGVRKPRGGQLVCMDLEGNEVYNSGADKFGHGPYMIADGLIFVMDNRGKLTMAAASTERYQPLGQFQVFADGHDAWGPMALVAGRLIVRDMTRMTCLDVAAGGVSLTAVNDRNGFGSLRGRWTRSAEARSLRPPIRPHDQQTRHSTAGVTRPDWSPPWSVAAASWALLPWREIDPSGDGGSGLSSSFDFDIEKYQRVDPELIRYRQGGRVPPGP